MSKKITLATVKRFIKAHGHALQIATLSRFDGMIDCVSACEDTSFSKIQAPAENRNTEHCLGISGAWFVFQSRDYFREYDEQGFVGIEVSNSCGRFVLAVPKGEQAPADPLAQIAEAVTHPAKQPRIVKQQIPLAMKPCNDSMPGGLVVQVYLRNVYGNTLVYPANVLGGQLAKFAGVKTFSLTQVGELRAMGITIEQVPDHLASELAKVTGGKFSVALQ